MFIFAVWFEEIEFHLIGVNLIPRGAFVAILIYTDDAKSPDRL